jgi:hypothetical protein
MTESVDLFNGLDTADSPASDSAVDDRSADFDNSMDNSTSTDESADSASDGLNQDSESPVETVAQIPDGAMSVTEFAAHMTQTLMRAKFQAGEDLDNSEYVVPQAVYQTVKAQRDRIPHVIVKGPEDAEGRVYILRDEATAWWQERKERLSTRGQGAARASSRTPEDNLTLLGEAVRKLHYATDREAMWTARIAQATKLVEKYQGFLTDAKIETETIELAIQEATDQYHAEKAAKDAEKAKNAKKGKSDNSDDDGE